MSEGRKERPASCKDQSKRKAFAFVYRDADREEDQKKVLAVSFLCANVLADEAICLRLMMSSFFKLNEIPLRLRVYRELGRF